MLIDSHCHLEDSRYGKPADDLVSEAEVDGVVKFINIGTSIHNNEPAIALAERMPQVYATVAIYPHEDTTKTLDELESALRRQLTLSKKIVAIGECGIDTSENWDGGRPVADQKAVFEMQIKLAIEKNLPLVIHNRNGDDIVLALLQKYKTPKLRGVLHCFSSTWEVAQQFMAFGFYISFSGMVTYPSRKELQEVARLVPMDKFLVETDAPYLPPQGHRGEVNVPKNVKIVAEKVAQLKGKPFEEISMASVKNTCALFGIDL
jgi:TatD DNase family protein